MRPNTSCGMKSMLGDVMTVVSQSLAASTSLSENTKMATILISDKVLITPNGKIYLPGLVD